MLAVPCAPSLADDVAHPIAMRWTGPDNQFSTSVAEDATGWWWGTDNDGLWHYAPNGKPGARWEHVRAQDGLYDDSITALAVDKLGRLWVGTERRGVSVSNGGWWRNYDVLTGPLGCHIYCLAIEPVSGDVWIGTEGGISIYSETTKKWRYVTRAEGLASDKVTAIAFGRAGKVFVGTASDGLVIGTTDCKSWTNLVALPDAGMQEVGKGLPGNMINCLAVGSGGKVYCGTASGLARSSDDGATWSYIHGWSWEKKVAQSMRRAHGGTFTDTQPPIADEFVSCLAVDKSGHVYVGHRQRGLEIYNDPKVEQIYHTPFDAHGVFVKAVAPVAGGVLIANYGTGTTLATWNDVDAAPVAAPSARKAGLPPPMPMAAVPPTTAGVKAMSAMVADVRKPVAVATPTTSTPALLPVASSPLPGNVAPSAYFLGEDWMTQGSWIGRYGRDFAVFCAEDGKDDLTLSSTPGYSVSYELGHSTHEGEDVSHWLLWDMSFDPRCLFDPTKGVRRQAEWNDHGERYAMTYNGPDLWLTVQVPEGAHRLSLYFDNKDGHSDVKRFRDYSVEVCKYDPLTPIARTYTLDTGPATLAQARVQNFWPGVYESFVVNGPNKYYVRLDKNYSLNLILQGVFLDRLDSATAPSDPVWLYGVKMNPDVFAVPKSPKAAKPAKPSPVIALAQAAWAALDAATPDARAAGLQRPSRIRLLRAAVAAGAPPELIAKWRWSLGIWTDADWQQFQDYMKRTQAAIAAKKSATP